MLVCCVFSPQCFCSLKNWSRRSMHLESQDDNPNDAVLQRECSRTGSSPVQSGPPESAGHIRYNISGANNAMNEWCIYTALYNHVGGLSSTTTNAFVEVYNSLPKYEHLLKIYLPIGRPRCRWVPIAHQWILCSEWVPSEWESGQLIKTSE